MLLAGSDSAPDHVAMTFGDRDFHVGLAELHSWLLRLGSPWNRPSGSSMAFATCDAWMAGPAGNAAFLTSRAG